MALPFLGAARAAGTVGGIVSRLPGVGKRERSAARAISPGDVAEFRAGRLSPHILWERMEDITAATGKPAFVWLGYGTVSERPNPAAVSMSQRVGINSLATATGWQGPWEQLYGSPEVAKVAELHMAVFVPIAEQLEGGKYTTDPGSGEGLAIYNAARGLFRDQIRTGRLAWVAPAIGTNGNQEPIGTVQPPGTNAPIQAGGLAMAAGVVVLLVLLKGRSS